MAHWVLHKIMEEALSKQYDNSIVKALTELNLPYSVVDFNINKRVFPDIIGPVISYGSIQFNRFIINTKLPYYPGYINTSENYQFHHFASYYSNEWLLNSDYKIMTFSEILRNKLVNVFIKPAIKHKQFTGFLLTEENWESEISRLHEGITGLQNIVELHDLVIVSSNKSIIQEYRCVLADGKYIDGCEYCWDHTIEHRVSAPNDVVELATKVAEYKWSPDRVFIADFCRLEDGSVKLIELNAFSTSGLYHCDLKKIINAVDPIINEIYGEVHVE